MASTAPSYTPKSYPRAQPLSTEVKQYKLLKSQGILGSLPTEPSLEASESITPINLRSCEDERPSKRNNSHLKVHAKHLSKIVQGTNSATVLTSNSTAQGSPYSGAANTPWIKEALSQYLSSFHKTLISPDSSPLSRGSSDKMIGSPNVKINKTPSVSSSTSTPINLVHSEITAPSQAKELRSPTGQQTKSKVAIGRQNIATASSKLLAGKSPQPNTERPKSGTTQSRSSLLANTLGSPKTDREVKSTKESRTNSMKVSMEADDWRAASEKGSDPYDIMNKRVKDAAKETGESRETITALKGQVETLKSMLTKYRSENTKLKETSSRDSVSNTRKSSTLRESVDDLKEENHSIKKTLDFLRDENGVLKKALADVKKYQQEADYYKRLAEFKFKECSVLAEEIICLRTDLDRCNSNLLRLQKAQNVQGGEELELLRSSSLRSGKSDKVKKGVSWKEELIEKSPINKTVKYSFERDGYEKRR